MGLLATTVWWLVGLAIVVAAYCAACIGLLFFTDIPNDPPYGYLIDAVFFLTFPFVLGVVVVATVRQG